MEVAISLWQAKGAARNSAVDPRHEPRQPAVGRSPDPWRTAQARYRRGSNLGRQIHGKAQGAPIPRVEDIPSQPRRWDRLNGSLRRSDTLVSTALRLAHSMPRPPSNLMAGSDGTPERRMDGPTTHRSLRLGMDAEVHRPRSRFCLWRNFHPAASRYGHSRPANRAPIAMAEWPYGTADRLDPAGMSRPCRRLWRAAPAPSAPFLHVLLQWRADTFISEQGCAAAAGYSSRWAHSPDTNSQRITSSLCSDLISDKDRGRRLVHEAFWLPVTHPDRM